MFKDEFMDRFTVFDLCYFIVCMHRFKEIKITNELIQLHGYGTSIYKVLSKKIILKIKN